MNEQNVIVSALPSLASCPKFIGQKESGPAAAFGSAFHKAMETEDIAHALTPDALKAAREGQGFGRAEIEEAYQWAQDWKAALIERYNPQVSLFEFEGKIEMIPGRRFFIDWLLLVDEEGTKVIIVDWKTGRGIYNAEENLQGKAYALAMFQDDVNVDQVIVTFVTPFVKGESSALYTRETSDQLAMEVFTVVRNAFNVDSTPVPGTACKYCGKFGRCEAVAELRDMEQVAGWLEEAKGSPELMSALLDLCPVLDKMMKEIKAAGNAMRFDRGVEIPGYTVVHTSSKSKVQEVKGTVNYLIGTMGLASEEILPYCNLSMSDLAEAITSTAKRGQKDATLEKALSDLRALGYVTGGNGDGVPYLKKSK